MKTLDIDDKSGSLLINLTPGTVEEAQCLIPELKEVEDEKLNELLKEINRAKFAK